MNQFLTPEKTCIVILAAGASTRLGQPKQLLPLNGKTLVQLSIDVASSIHPKNIIVVLGAYADDIQNTIKPGIDQQNVQIIVNDNWEEGLASSIRFGVKQINKLHSEIEAIILMLCDQPFVTKKVLFELISTFNNSSKTLVACNYGPTYGPPVLIVRQYFNQLLQLTGNQGAKKILENNIKQVAFIDFVDGIKDIDTQEDYTALIST